MDATQRARAERGPELQQVGMHLAAGAREGVQVVEVEGARDLDRDAVVSPKVRARVLVES